MYLRKQINSHFHNKQMTAICSFKLASSIELYFVFNSKQILVCDEQIKPFTGRLHILVIIVLENSPSKCLGGN